MVTRIFFLILILQSCSTDYSTIKKINREAIFHGNASKIWVINKVQKKGVNYTSLRLKDKDIILFYENGKIVIQPMKTLGTFPSKTGRFELSDDNKRCEFRFPNETWEFETVEVNAKIISLKSRNKSTFPYDLEIISFPDSEELKIN
jgi:hypothetical protein